MVAMPVGAQEPTTVPKSESSVLPVLKNEVRDLRQNVKTEVKDLRQNVKTEIRDARQSVKSEVRDLRQNVQVEVKNVRESIRGALPEKREEAKRLMEQKREEAKALMRQKREEFKARVEARREELKKRVEAKREELKERLKKIKDERKKQVVVRIDERLNAINANRVERFTENLDKIQKALDHVVTRTDKAADRGLDVTAVRTAVTNAQTAINASKAAIEAQASKTYTLTVNTEITLRSDVGVARQALHKDLQAVFETLRNAHDMVRRAAVALAQVPRVDEDANETPSATTAAPTETAPSQ